MMAFLSPSDRFIEENLSTLNYASRAGLISNLSVSTDIGDLLCSLRAWKTPASSCKNSAAPTGKIKGVAIIYFSPVLPF